MSLQVPDLQQGNDVLIILDVGDAHAHHTSQRIHHDLVVEGMRLVLRATGSLISIKSPASLYAKHVT